MTTFKSDIILNICEAVDEGLVTAEYIVNGCMYWLGEEGVKEMVAGQYDFMELNEVFPIESKSDLVELLDDDMMNYQTAMELILHWIGTTEVCQMVDRQPDLDGLSELMYGDEDEDED